MRYFRLLFALLMIACAVPMFATNYYVSTTGSDSNNCSQTSPCATIAHADSLTSPGDIVHVAPGTYTQAITTTHNGTAAAYITFISDTKWGAHITQGSAYQTWAANGAYVVIQGFDITGTGTSTVHEGILGGFNANYNTYTQNRVHDIDVPCDSNGGAGINTQASNVTIDRNWVFGMGTWNTACEGIHGIYVSQPNITISNNVVYHNIGSQINIYHDTANHDTIVNNTVFEGGYNAGGGTCYGAGISIGGATMDYTVIANNILEDNNCWAIDQLDSSVGTHDIIENNLLYNNLLSIYASKGTVSGNVTANPLFVNYVNDGSGDYHLTATSPAVGLALATYAPSIDFDGISRPQGSSYDAGAYEYIATSGGGGGSPPPAFSTIGGLGTLLRNGLAMPSTCTNGEIYVSTTAPLGIRYCVNNFWMGPNNAYKPDGTQALLPHIVWGDVALSSGSAVVSFSGSAQYSVSTSFECTANDYTAANSVQVTKNSGSQITLTGNASDLIGFICHGN